MIVRAEDMDIKTGKPESDERNLDLLVEQICQLGCDAVNHIITQIGQGQVPEQAHHLSAHQLLQLRLELEEVMMPLRR